MHSCASFVIAVTTIYVNITSTIVVTKNAAQSTQHAYTAIHLVYTKAQNIMQ